MESTLDHPVLVHDGLQFLVVGMQYAFENSLKVMAML